MIRAAEIRDQFPSLLPHLDRIPSDREPADPYIIAYAQMHDLTVVTNELHRSDRTRSNKSGDHVPDVCEGLSPKVEWLYLAEFAAIEHLLE